MIGRYISENYNGTALHPIDFIDISNGQLVAEVMDPSITNISPVNKLHPREDFLASGSSRFRHFLLNFSLPIEDWSSLLYFGLSLPSIVGYYLSLAYWFSFRSLFIWRPEDRSDPVEQKDERKLIICGSAGKKQKGKFGDESDDSDDDTCGTKGKKSKSRKSEFKSSKIVKKTKK